MRSRPFPRITVLYLILGSTLVFCAFQFQLQPVLLNLAVAVTLPWSFAYGLFIWSAIHGLEHELGGYLLVCLCLNTAIIYVLERRWQVRQQK